MSIRFKILSIMSITILMITILVSVFVYKTMKKTLHNGVDEKLVTAANFAKAVLPENYHDVITGAHSVSKKVYDKIVDKNNKLCLDLDLQYIWSVMIVDNQILFTSATSPGKDISKGEHAKFFEVHRDPHAFDAVFSTMKVNYSSFKNEWGHGRMVLIPYYDINGRAYCFGASMSINQVAAILHKTFFNAFVVGGLILIIGLFVSILLSKALSDPITELCDSAENIAKKNYNQSIKIDSSEQVKTLKGLLPICSNCKKIRDDKGYWNLLESYIEKHSSAIFSHSLCPECLDKIYGNQDWYIKKKKRKGNV